MSKKTDLCGALPDHSAHSARHVPNLFRLSMLGMAMMLLCGAFVLLFNAGSLAPRHASAAQVGYDDLSIDGPPSLPAATVNIIFARLGSPMSGTGAVVEQTSAQTHIDDAFALAVWWTETNDGAAGVGLADRNPGSVRGSSGYPSAYDGYTIYPDYTDAIVYWFHMLRNLYVDRGLATVYAISHPYVGTSGSPAWAGKIIALMLRYRGEAPAPTPVPPIQASPTFSPDLPHYRPAALFSGALRTDAPTPIGQPGWSQPPALADATQSTVAGRSSVGTWSIALFALLLALVIALWSLKFLPMAGFVQSRNIGAQHDHTIEPLRLPARPLHQDMPGALSPAPGLFAQMPETPEIPGVMKIRRTTLVPIQPDSEVMEQATTGTRPTGLLARYGQKQ